jgi:hypothetical protein
MIWEVLQRITNGLHHRRSYPQKIDLADQQKLFYGQHRSGWPFVLKLLSRLHNPRGILLDSFIERTFCWRPGGPTTNLRPWIGIIHIPPNVPVWFQHEQSNEAIFGSQQWKESLPYCRGLFTLSDYHRKRLQPKLRIPLDSLTHPTEIPKLKWSEDRFAANREKKIIQVGWWLRKLHTIYMLPTRSYKKIFLRVTHTDLDSLLKKEREILIREGAFQDSMYETAQSVFHVPDAAYDRLIAENIVIVNLYDSSSNNTIIECIMRNTPILVNPIEPVVEYLGPDYPLYFSSLEEAADKAENPDLLFQTSLFLKNHPVKEKLTADFFLRTFVNSKIYRDIEI